MNGDNGDNEEIVEIVEIVEICATVRGCMVMQCVYMHIYIHIHIYYEAYIYITNKHDVGLFNITNINEDKGVSMEKI